MTALREIRRLRYLEALGVVPLVSRRPLPGAAATRKLRLRPGAAESAGKTASRAGRPADHVDAAGTLRQQLTDAPGQRPVSSPGREAAAPELPAKAPAPPAERFCLAVLHAGDQLWIEELVDAVLAREQVELVAAMARALAHPLVQDEKPGVAQFDWPLHGNTQLDLGPGEAASALAGFLNRQLGERAPARLVCLGAAAAQRVGRLELACPHIELPSTREMLDDPLLKRRAWQVLGAR